MIKRIKISPSLISTWEEWLTAGVGKQYLLEAFPRLLLAFKQLRKDNKRLAGEVKNLKSIMNNCIKLNAGKLEKELTEKMKNIPKEFTELVDKHFWSFLV